MEGTNSMKEVINKNVDSNKQEKKLKKISGLKKRLSVTFLKTAKMLLLKTFQKMIKPIFHVILKMIWKFWGKKHS